MMKIVVVLLAMLFGCTAHAARIALVIGNSAYSTKPLDNPVNDARAMSTKLQSLGFTVIKKENMRQREVGGVLRELRSKIKAGDEVLVFYAGHGLQVKGVNYLPVVDADIQSEDDVPLQSLSLDQVLTVLDESKAGVKLLFLDACRDNPFARSFRSSAGGDLGRISSAPSGTLIHYATRPGSVAADGKKGGNGLYTENLLKHISERGLAIEAMHKRVSAGVRSASHGKQEPWTEGQLEGEYYFGGAAKPVLVTQAATATPNAASSGTDEDVEYWNVAVRDSKEFVSFMRYLAKYPTGRYAEVAKEKVGGIRFTREGCLVAGLQIMDMTLAWSGACLNGLADGEGMLTLEHAPYGTGNRFGRYASGIPIGTWKIDNSASQAYIDGGLLTIKLATVTYIENRQISPRQTWEDKSGRKYAGETDASITKLIGTPHGLGEFTYPEGSSYKGNFVNGARSGWGIYKFAIKPNPNPGDWISYEGEFLNGQAEGRGTAKFHSGGRYEGEFKQGKFYGQGRMFDAQNQVTRQGQFANGVFEN